MSIRSINISAIDRGGMGKITPLQFHWLNKMEIWLLAFFYGKYAANGTSPMSWKASQQNISIFAKGVKKTFLSNSGTHHLALTKG